jgi:hypothetical protein
VVPDAFPMFAQSSVAFSQPNDFDAALLPPGWPGFAASRASTASNKACNPAT